MSNDACKTAEVKSSMTVKVNDPHGLIESVNVMAESPSAVVLRVELTGKDIEPNCAGRDDTGDGIWFYRIAGGKLQAVAEIQILGLPVPDVDGIGPVWAYTEAGYKLVTVTITPSQHGRTVYEREAVEGE